MKDRSAETDRVKYRPPSKLPYTVNVNREITGCVEKKDLPYVVPKPKPSPKPPPKFYDIARVSWTW